MRTCRKSFIVWRTWDAPLSEPEFHLQRNLMLLGFPAVARTVFVLKPSGQPLGLKGQTRSQEQAVAGEVAVDGEAAKGTDPDTTQNPAKPKFPLAIATRFA